MMEPGSRDLKIQKVGIDVLVGRDIANYPENQRDQRLGSEYAIPTIHHACKQQHRNKRNI